MSEIKNKYYYQGKISEQKTMTFEYMVHGER
jgi:hypothetical protein